MISGMTDNTGIPDAVNGSIKVEFKPPVVDPGLAEVCHFDLSGKTAYPV